MFRGSPTLKVIVDDDMKINKAKFNPKVAALRKEIAALKLENEQLCARMGRKPFFETESDNDPLADKNVSVTNDSDEVIYVSIISPVPKFKGRRPPLHELGVCHLILKGKTWRFQVDDPGNMHVVVLTFLRSRILINKQILKYRITDGDQIEPCLDDEETEEDGEDMEDEVEEDDGEELDDDSLSDDGDGDEVEDGDEEKTSGGDNQGPEIDGPSMRRKLDALIEENKKLRRKAKLKQ